MYKPSPPQTQWCHHPWPFQTDLWTPGPPAKSPFQLSPVHCGSHPPANLMSTSPAGVGQPSGAAFVDRALWGATKQKSRFGWGSGMMSPCWVPAVGRARSVHRLARPTTWPGSSGRRREAWLGPEGPREPGGSRSCPREPLGLGSGSGSPGRGSGRPQLGPHTRPPGPGGRRRGPGRPETCLAVGGCELGQGQPRQAGRPALLGDARRGSSAARSERPGNGGPER